MTFRIPGASWQIVFSDEALGVLDTHRQRRTNSRESVGQIYTADLTQCDVVVQLATVLEPMTASIHSVAFSPEAARREREVLFERGLHCIGLWHSHPQRYPTPSGLDLQLAADHARAARGHITGILFAIVGTAAFPEGLFVGVHDSERLLRAI
ncbi:Mov34/MPN/PAD-1 family protein [Cupriavidus sp. amp6]|uniref:Mov34/MPN/PAD-1 family protein n=1 Tax=Cupriavidus sp. amp6 TaxID=388051 RepID=UPI0009FF6A36|nr:Mov34/MPN/PAD-1 family protein [Cupriavidus sp. amp6]